MPYKASDITQKLIVRRLQVYNRRVNKLKKLGGSYELLQNKTVKDIITGRTDAEIARELNQLEKLGQKKQQTLVKYSRESNVKVPLYFRNEIERELRRANKLSEKARAEMHPSKEAGNLSSLESENLRAITKGSGASLKAIEKRAESIRNRSKESYYTKLLNQYKENYKEAVRKELGIYADSLNAIVDKIDAKQLFLAIFDEMYGSDMEINYVYGEQAQEERYNTIVNAIEKLGLI